MSNYVWKYWRKIGRKSAKNGSQMEIDFDYGSLSIGSRTYACNMSVALI